VDILTSLPSPTALRRSWGHFGNLPPHLVVGIAGSGLVHVAAVVLVSIAFSAFASLQVYPPAPGVASIQLVASFEAAMDVAEPVDVSAVEIVMQPELTDAAANMSVAPALDDCSLEAPTRRVSPLGKMPARMRARAEPIDVPETVRVANLGTKTTRACPPQAKPQLQPAERPSRKRADSPPRPADTTARVDAEPAKASAASQASRGARSTVAIRARYSPDPDYPPEALAAGLTGRVVLRVAIDREGRVARARVYRSSGVPSLDASALTAVRRWRFEPMGDMGIAQTTEVAVPIRFRIE
jgi:protein TonB